MGWSQSACVTEFTVGKKFMVGKEFMVRKEFMVGKEFKVQWKKSKQSSPHIVRVSYGAEPKCVHHAVHGR